MGVVLKSQLPTNSHPNVPDQKNASDLGPLTLGNLLVFQGATTWMVGWRNVEMKGRCMTGWWLNQPIWKIWSSNWKSSPSFGVKIKNIGNHHLDQFMGFLLGCFLYGHLWEGVQSTLPKDLLSYQLSKLWPHSADLVPKSPTRHETFGSDVTFVWGKKGRLIMEGVWLIAQKLKVKRQLLQPVLKKSLSKSSLYSLLPPPPPPPITTTTSCHQLTIIYYYDHILP